MRKKFTARLMTAMLVVTTLIATAIPVSAETVTKQATLNEMKISFDGRKMTIKTYLVDGYNYVMARAITNELGMNVSANYWEGQIRGITMSNLKEKERIEPVESPTEKNITVTMKSGPIHSYYGIPGRLIRTNEFSVEGKFFIHNERAFFKLADMAQATQLNKNKNIEGLKKLSKKEISEIFPDTPLKSFIINWNEATRTVEVKTETTDIKKIWSDLHNTTLTPTPTPEPEPTPTPVVPTPTPTPTPINSENFAEEVLRLVNIEREKVGSNPVKLNTTITKATQFRADDMVENNYFGHVSPVHGSWLETLKQFGINSSAAENCAAGATTPEKAVTIWMNSTAGHRENMLNPIWTDMGLGYATGDNTDWRYYWVQIFAKII